MHYGKLLGNGVDRPTLMLLVGFSVLDTNGKQAVNMLKLPQFYRI